MNKISWWNTNLWSHTIVKGLLRKEMALYIVSLSMILSNSKTTFSAGITVRSCDLFNKLLSFREKGEGGAPPPPFLLLPVIPLPPSLIPRLFLSHPLHFTRANIMCEKLRNRESLVCNCAHPWPFNWILAQLQLVQCSPSASIFLLNTRTGEL